MLTCNPRGLIQSLITSEVQSATSNLPTSMAWVQLVACGYTLSADCNQAFFGCHGHCYFEVLAGTIEHVKLHL